MALVGGKRIAVLGSMPQVLPATPLGSTFLLAEGNSITAGAMVPASYVKLYSDTNAKVRLQNNAVSGSKLDDVVGRLSTDAGYIAANPGYANYAYVLLVGINDVDSAAYYPNGAAQFGTDLAAHLTNVRSAGFTKIIICTLIDSIRGTASWRADISAQIRNLVPTHADVCVDFSTSSPMGTVGSALSTKLFQDGVHPTSIGQIHMERIFAPVMNAAMAAAQAPGAPSGLTAGTVTTTTIPLSWTAPSTGGYYTDFAIRYALAGSGSWQSFTHTGGRAVTDTLDGLTASTSYDIQTAAIGEGGQGDWSGTLTVSTASSIADTFDATAKGANIVLSNGNKTATNSTNLTWSTVRSAISKSSGKWYAEFKLGAVASTAAVIWGLTDTTATSSTMNDYTGHFNYGAGLATSGGQRYVAGFSFIELPTAPNAVIDRVLMVAFDIDNKRFWLGYDGTWLASGDPATGAHPTGSWSANYTAIAAAISLVCFSSVSSAATWQPAGSQSYAPPTGFSGL